MSRAKPYLFITVLSRTKIGANIGSAVSVRVPTVALAGFQRIPNGNVCVRPWHTPRQCTPASHRGCKVNETNDDNDNDTDDDKYDDNDVNEKNDDDDNDDDDNDDDNDVNEKTMTMTMWAGKDSTTANERLYMYRREYA